MADETWEPTGSVAAGNDMWSVRDQRQRVRERGWYLSLRWVWGSGLVVLRKCRKPAAL